MSAVVRRRRRVRTGPGEGALRAALGVFTMALALLLAAAWAMALTGCSAPDGRRGVVQPGPGVDRAALEAAIAGLHAATAGDTDLAIGACDGRRYCVVLVAVADYRCPDGRRCSGYTNEPGAEGVVVHVDAVFGNDAASIAHELLHAVGVEEHAKGDAPEELMHWERYPGAVRVFGPATARVYRDAFGVTPDTSAAVVFE